MSRRESDIKESGTSPYRGPYGWVRHQSKLTVQAGLARLARDRDLYLAEAPANAAAIDGSRFLRGLWSQTKDFVRYGTLELLVREINSRNVPGDVAELGVFQGYFAAAMNSHLADRRLFLFDTFAGFDERDIRGDRAKMMKSRPGDFTATNVATVMDRMPSPQQVVPVVGWFPESTNGLPGNERFCLVSLDADLYDPTLAGLEWFYPRLSPGGYILVHDYNNNRYPGARLAVEEFSARASVVVVPLPDSGGTCVIGRPLL